MTFLPRTWRRAGVFVTVAALALSVSAPTAWGALDDVPNPLGSSSTNPNVPTDASVWWREGWGNTVRPVYNLNPPGVTSPEMLLGTIYSIDRSPFSVIDTNTPGLYYRTAIGTGAHLTHSLDLPGTLAYPPLGGWPALEPGAVMPIEGTWYYHFRWFSNLAYSSAQLDIPVKIDVTPPRAVTGLKVEPAIGVPSTGWVESSRAHVSWDPGPYDDLAGDAYYEVQVDGSTVIPASSGLDQGRIWAMSGMGPTAVTIEDMPAGAHVVSVRTVDRATNTGAVSSVTFMSDPDVPTVALTAPANGGRFVPVSAEAADGAGVKYVEFLVGSTVVAKDNAAPYAATIDMAPFGTGDRTVTARAVDNFGHAGTDSKTVHVVDVVAPVISGMSDSPDPFFPIKRDRYKDNMVARFHLAKHAYVVMHIYDATGAEVRTLASWRNAGWNTFTWNGMNNSGTRTVGTYTYRFTADDGGYNTHTSATGVTHLRSYILVRLRRNRVRVVYH